MRRIGFVHTAEMAMAAHGEAAQHIAQKKMVVTTSSGAGAFL